MALAKTTRTLILEAVRARQTRVLRTYGFATDAGRSVFLGEAPALGPDDPETAVAILVLDDSVRAQGNKLFVTLPVGLCALAKADLNEPWAAAEALLGDIKTAMELADRTLGGLLAAPMERDVTRALDRETGSTTVGAMVTYVLSYAETWGAP